MSKLRPSLRLFWLGRVGVMVSIGKAIIRSAAAFAMLCALPISGAALAGDIIPPSIYTMTPGGINTSDGSYNFSRTDLSIGTLSLQRSYSASPGTASDADLTPFGLHMTSNFDIFVTKTTVVSRQRPPLAPYDKLVVHLGTDTGGIFTGGPPVYDGYSGKAGTGGLQMISGAYVYTDHSGAIYTFNPSVPALSFGGGGGMAGSQKVASIAYPDGRVRTFTYTSGTLLKMVSDSTGYAIIFDYGPSNTVTAACAFDLSQTYVTAASTCAGAALTTGYGYAMTMGSPARIYQSSATDVLGQTETYNIGPTGFCLTPPGYSACKVLVYNAATTQVQQTLADGSVWNITGFNYSRELAAGVVGANENGNNGAHIVDPNGKATDIVMTYSSPNSMTDADGRTTNYVYTGATDDDVGFYPPGTPLNEGIFLIEADYPEGNKYLAEYDGIHNELTKQTLVAKPGSGLADIVVQYGYASCTPPYYLPTPTCTPPIWKKDALGNETDFAYAAWGGVTSEMDPAPSSGSARPLKLYDYVQKYAYIQNGGGGLVAASAPVWLPNSETVCQTAVGSSTASCDPSAPIMVTTYQYGADGTADNLLPRGKAVTAGGGLTLRTCYAYDPWGNKTSETKPNANLSVCP